MDPNMEQAMIASAKKSEDMYHTCSKLPVVHLMITLSPQIKKPDTDKQTSLTQCKPLRGDRLQVGATINTILASSTYTQQIKIERIIEAIVLEQSLWIRKKKSVLGGAS
jgi:hypothetical protein